MSFPFTIGGQVFVESDFNPYAYVTNFPRFGKAVGDVGADVASKAAVVDVKHAEVVANAATVATSKDTAVAAAAVAAPALGLIADSTTSLAIATGDKTFAVASGKGFAPGMPVRASSKANPDTQAMIGVVKSYSGSTLVVNVGSVVGSETRADWTIVVTGGALAPVGSTQDAQAIIQMARLERSLAAAGVPDEASLILDFIRGVHFASKTAIAASIVALIAALPGSSFTRASTGTFTDSDGLLKTAANNVPRIDYDPVTRALRGLLIENQARTNLCLRSEEFDNAVWIKTNVTAAANAAMSPTGAVTADRLIETSTNGGHAFSQNCSGTNNANPEAVSVFIAAAGRTRFRLWLFDVATFTRAFFVDVDLAAKTISAVTASGGAAAGSSELRDLGGGRFRVSMSGTLGGSGTSSQFRINFMDASGSQSYAGDGSSGFDFWGAQIEAGAAPSSYIPTVASTVTRAADEVTIGSGGWLAAGPLSALIEFRLAEVRGGGTASSPFMLFNSAGPDRIWLREGSVIGGADLYTISNAGVIQIDSGDYPAPALEAMRFALGLDATSYGLAKNNVTSVTGGASTLPLVLDRLRIGGGGFMGHIKRVIVYPQRLSNAKAQILSGSAWS